MTSSTRAQARQLLTTALGLGAEFRPGQLEAIEASSSGARACSSCSATGWGKSVVYFIATRLLREHGAGPTCSSSPAARADAQPDPDGRAARHSGAHDQQREHATTGMRSRRTSRATLSTSCSSRPSGSATTRFHDRGARRDPARHRPARRRRGALHLATGATTSGPTTAGSSRVVRLLPRERARARARLRRPTTASIADIARAARARPRRRSAARSPARACALQSIDLPDQAERLAWLATVHSASCRGRGIVYCLTVADADRVASWLRSSGIDAERVQRRDSTRRARAARGRAAARTSQGARRDRRARHGVRQAGPRLRRPLPAPGLAVAYYQQIGRAGRALDDAIACAAARSGRGRDPGLLRLHRVPRRMRRSVGCSRSSRPSRVSSCAASRRRST